MNRYTCQTFFLPVEEAINRNLKAVDTIGRYKVQNGTWLKEAIDQNVGSSK